MFKLLVVLAAAVAIAYGDCLATQTTVEGSAAPASFCSGDIIFQDEFDYGVEDAHWNYEKTLAGGGNGEFQWYDSYYKNSYVRDGILYIVPTLLSDDIGEDALYSTTITVEGCTDSSNYGCQRTGTDTNIVNPVRSARINTANKFAFRYGRLEARVKTPAGDWLWPAVWLLPQDNVYGGWPMSGEIDILESRGNLNLLTWDGGQIGNSQVLSTLHWGTSVSEDRYSLTSWWKNADFAYSSDFHTYVVTWTPDGITFTVDGEEIGSIYPSTTFYEMGGFTSENIWGDSKLGPLNQPFYIILNLAVGGTNGFFPDDATNGNGAKPWSNGSPTPMTDFWKARDTWYSTWDGENSALQIDYVRVYAL